MEEMSSAPLILDWSRLGTEQIEERIGWLRETLIPGEDWGYCNELVTCVLQTPSASMLYRLRWFETGQQELINQPMMLQKTLNSETFNEGYENVWEE